MDPDLWLPLLCGMVVGLSLGLTGGGGSIFALPLLLYVLDVPLREAVVVSLAVVGLTALFGAATQGRKVLWGAGIALGVGGIAGAPAGAWLGARLPDAVMLGLFSLLMLFIASRMWRGGASEDVPVGRFTCARDSSGLPRFHLSCAAKLVAAGAVTGVLSGVFGVGGGFLVVPALLIVTAAPMDRVLATSLVGIALISGSAFAANIAAVGALPVALGAWFLLGGFVGMTAGTAIKARLSGPVLRRIFATSIVGVAIWIAVRTLTSVFA